MKKLICLAFCVLMMMGLLSGCTSENKGSDVYSQQTITDAPYYNEDDDGGFEEDILLSYEALQAGSTGEDVIKLQNRLIELNYLPQGSASGTYDENTKNAVMKFQEKCGYAQTGTADASTQYALYSRLAPFSENVSNDVISGTLPLAGYVIGIDPGRQLLPNTDQEPVAPGSGEMKNKVAAGSKGTTSGVEEYEVNLNIALKLREQLQKYGATVVMTRETNNVDISNAQRGQFFNNNNTDYAIRLFCSSSNDQTKNGTFLEIPSAGAYQSDCELAAEKLINAYCAATGFQNLGVNKVGDKACFNWCNRMIVSIQLGYLSNQAEEQKIISPSYQDVMVQGIVNGIIDYFGSK